MILLTKDDLLTLIDLYTLDTVTGGDDTLLDSMEANAIEEMTAYLNARYNTDTIFDPAEDTNKLVKLYLCDIILYHLHTRISPDNIPELRKDRYQNARDWLEKAADGFTSPILPTKEDSATMPIRYGSSSPKTDQYY